MKSTVVPVCVVGGGVIGLSVALGLAQSGLSVMVLDSHDVDYFNAQANQVPYDARIFALNQRAMAYFESINVLPDILAARCAQFYRMHLWSKERNQSLTLTEQDHVFNQLGYIVEQSVLLSALWKAVSEDERITVRHAVKITDLNETGRVVLEEDEIIQATLLIGADGARSFVRETLGIPYIQKSYHQSALVVNVEHTVPHQQTAFQCFAKDEPLAFLPLSNSQHSSVVWSGETAHIDALFNLSEQDFIAALSEASEQRLGDFKLLGKVNHFPLQQLHVRQYVKSHTVLMGDAAHVIHPMAGWGMNLGLLDVAEFVDGVKLSLKKRQSICEAAMLRRYERRRRSHNAWMLKLISALKFAFTHEMPFTWVQHQAWLKNCMIQVAAGESRLPYIIR